MVLVQLIISQNFDGWVLLKDGIQYGSYPRLDLARDVAAMLAEQIKLEGNECEMLIRHLEGWRAESCPHSDRAS